jgi:hypothetical protein
MPEQRITDLLPAPLDPLFGYRAVADPLQFNNGLLLYSAANAANYVVTADDDLRFVPPGGDAAFGLQYGGSGFLEGNWSLTGGTYTTFADTNDQAVINKEYLVSYVASNIPATTDDLLNNLYDPGDTEVATARATQEYVRNNVVSSGALDANGYLRLAIGPPSQRLEVVVDLKKLTTLFTPTPPSVKTAVTATSTTWTNGELQGAQPVGSVPGMKFCNATYRYEYMNGMNDTTGNQYVWTRTQKV